VEFLWLINCSSIEKRIADNPLHADANVDAMVLKVVTITFKKKNVNVSYKSL